MMSNQAFTKLRAAASSRRIRSSFSPNLSRRSFTLTELMVAVAVPPLAMVPNRIVTVLLPLMMPIEVISQLARPLALAVRLFANMTAGHTILAVLFGMALSLPLLIGWLPGETKERLRTCGIEKISYTKCFTLL